MAIKNVKMLSLFSLLFLTLSTISFAQQQQFQQQPPQFQQQPRPQFQQQPQQQQRPQQQQQQPVNQNFQQGQQNFPLLPPVFIPPNQPSGPAPAASSPVRNLFRDSDDGPLTSLFNRITRFFSF